MKNDGWRRVRATQNVFFIEYTKLTAFGRLNIWVQNDTWKVSLTTSMCHRVATLKDIISRDAAKQAAMEWMNNEQ